MNRLGKLKKKLEQYISAAGRSQREMSVELTRYELRELENIFVLLVIGSFIGIPAPPCSVSIELLPFLEHELEILNQRASESSDALAELVGSLDID